jgi:hypothetical protein
MDAGKSSLSRFSSFVVAVVFALVASLILGGVLGYTLKPPVTVPGRTQVIVVHESNPGMAAGACNGVSANRKDC